MFPLFETIRYYNGIAENLSFHQERVNHTLQTLKAKHLIQLQNCIYAAATLPPSNNTVYKCRVLYDLLGNYEIQFEPYSIKVIQTLSFHEMGENTYCHKFTNRNWLNEILHFSGTDEVILTQNGFIKDASYANLAFFNGQDWFTPQDPLLLGTRRQALLNSGIIQAAPIALTDLHTFKQVKLINAMMLWEESPQLDCPYL